MCDNKGPTVTVLRLQNEVKIFGGYNPFNWDKSKGEIYEKTSDSFIFSLNREIILSRVQNYDQAIYQHYECGSCFNDLHTFNATGNGVGVGVYFNYKDSYD